MPRPSPSPRDATVIIYFLLAVLCVVGATTSYLFFSKDNLLEEAIEEMVEENTGLDIDLTPFSSEA